MMEILGQQAVVERLKDAIQENNTKEIKTAQKAA